MKLWNLDVTSVTRCSIGLAWQEGEEQIESERDYKMIRPNSEGLLKLQGKLSVARGNWAHFEIVHNYIDGMGCLDIKI